MNKTTLKSVLIILTIIELLYFAVIFYDDKLWIKLDYEFKANLIIGFFHLIVVGLFLKKIWSENIKEKKKKIDKTFMILILGIIGMWIYIEKNTTHNNS